MQLKRYLDFIKESNSEENNFWKVSKEDIEDWLLPFKDSNYLTDIEFGFVETVTKYRYNGPNYEEDVFSKKVYANEETKPAYWIQIARSKDTNSEDLTDDLHFLISILKKEANAEIELYDSDGRLDENNLLVKGGIFIDAEEGDAYSGTEVEQYLALFVKSDDIIKLKPKDLSKYYGWKCDEILGDDIFVHINLEDLTNQLLSSRSHYTKMLNDGEEGLWDYYDISSYYPDINSLFQYTLSKENSTLLIKSMIKEAGGLEDIKRHIGDECDNDVYEDVKELSEEELIDYLLKERFKDTIKQLGRNSEIWSDINQTVADYEMSAHLHDNYKELVDEFDDCVRDEFKFTKFKKEVEKSWKSKDAEGNEAIRKYTEEETFYRIQYENKWIADLDSEDLFKYNLDGIFIEYCGNLERYELRPHFSDYGDVDSKKMNSEINSILSRFLSE